MNIKKYSPNIVNKSKTSNNFAKKNYIEYYTPKIDKKQQ